MVAIMNINRRLANGGRRGGEGEGEVEGGKWRGGISRLPSFNFN